MPPVDLSRQRLTASARRSVRQRCSLAYRMRACLEFVPHGHACFHKHSCLQASPRQVGAQPPADGCQLADELQQAPQTLQEGMLSASSLFEESDDETGSEASECALPLHLVAPEQPSEATQAQAQAEAASSDQPERCKDADLQLEAEASAEGFRPGSSDRSQHPGSQTPSDVGLEAWPPQNCETS